MLNPDVAVVAIFGAYELGYILQAFFLQNGLSSGFVFG